jgi:putative FmdB family regulatory protein
MPTYEYHCDACEHGFEEFQSMSDAPLTKCPKCRQKKLRRLFGTGAAILFKGSGFYQTDYRSESYKAAAKADQESTKSSTNGAGSTDSKADTSSSGAKETTPKPAAKRSKSKTRAADD